MTVSIGIGVCLGALHLLVVAFAVEHHDVAAVAWAEAALSLGSVLGGLVYGARTWRSAPSSRLRLVAVALGLVVAAAGLAADFAQLMAMAALAGLFVSPALTTAYIVADEAAPEGARTRAGAWVNTGFNLGDSGGAAGIGVLLARLPLFVCFLLTGVPAVVAALVAHPRGCGGAGAPDGTQPDGASPPSGGAVRPRVR